MVPKIDLTQLHKGFVSKTRKKSRKYHFDCTLCQSDRVSLNVQLATKYVDMPRDYEEVFSHCGTQNDFERTSGSVNEGLHIK